LYPTVPIVRDAPPLDAQVAGPLSAARPARVEAPGDPGEGPRAARVRAIAAGVELAAAGAAVLGAAVEVATLVVGRSALLWPSATWLLVAAGAGAVAVLVWWLGARAAPGTPQAAVRRWHAAAWPVLALLPAAAAGAAIYVDDASHHIVSAYLPARQSLLAYSIGLFAVAQVAYWLTRWARRGRGAAEWSPAGALPPVVLGVAAAAYVNASIYAQWVPRQTDLRVNLNGARDLLAGTLPYHDAIPVWADRVHLLPATLVLLFGPLALLPDDAARVVFFLGNQVLWLGAIGLFIRRLVPPEARSVWLAAALGFGATYWPWQEAIRFGQQDGLLILLFVASILAAAQAREGRAGVLLGLAFVVKPLSIWLPLIYLLHGRWRSLLAAAATAAALALATLPLIGLAPWWHFLRVEVPEMLPGTVRGTNIPLPSLHARLFVGREALSNGDPAPTLAVIAALNLAANALALWLVCRLALSHAGRARALGDCTRPWLLDAALGLCLTLLLAPMAWQHYASWLTIAFLVLGLPLVWRPLPPAARAAVGALAGAGFLLLSLEDGHLVDLLSPLLDGWPGILGFYAAGLLCVTGAVLVARRAAPRAAPAADGGTADRT
jgi:hypothetical protein